MATHRLLAALPSRNVRIALRALHTTRIARAAEDAASTVPPSSPASEKAAEEVFEITESKRRHVEGVHGRNKPSRQARPAKEPSETAPTNEQTAASPDVGGPSKRPGQIDGKGGAGAGQSDEISLDLLSAESPARSSPRTTKVKSNKRPQQGKSGQNQRPGQPGRSRRAAPRDTSRADRRDRGDTTDRRPVQREVVRENAVYDTSFAGLFGRASLVMPARRGARDPEGSAWAKDMNATDARKSDLLRLAGSYDLRLRSAPHASTLKDASPADRAKVAARWAFAVNPTVGMRRVEPGLSALERLLR